MPLHAGVLTSTECPPVRMSPCTGADPGFCNGGGGGKISSEARYICNELRGIMARSTQFPNMITRSTIIYEIVSPGAAGSSIYI